MERRLPVRAALRAAWGAGREELRAARARLCPRETATASLSPGGPATAPAGGSTAWKSRRRSEEKAREETNETPLLRKACFESKNAHTGKVFEIQVTKTATEEIEGNYTHHNLCEQALVLGFVPFLVEDVFSLLWSERDGSH